MSEQAAQPMSGTNVSPGVTGAGTEKVPPVSTVKRVSTLPLATRLLVGLGLFLVMYFLVFEPMIDSTNRALAAAESKSALIATYSKTAASLESAASTVATGMKRFGHIEMPGDAEKRPLEFNQAVDEILRRNSVRESTSNSRTSPLGAGPLGARVGTEFRVDRLQRDIQFTADPDLAAAVIADLERTPIVSTISRLQIRQADGKDKGTKMVRVTMTVETWLLARKGRR